MKTQVINESFKYKNLTLAVVAASSVLMGVPVFAEDAEKMEGHGLEEVVVTAQKREQSFQDLAISAAVLSAEALDVRGITQVQDAIKSVPGVKVQNVAGTGAGRVFIRGIGTTSGDEFDGIKANGVSLNLDGVQSNNASNTLGSMFDVERVEVLKGPQGTLYGSGALGGVVNVITAKPSQDFEGKVKLQAGNYGQQSVQAMINLPVTDTFALRITGTKDERDGYIDKPSWLTESGEAGWRQVADHEGMPYDAIVAPDGTPIFPGFGFLLGLVGGIDSTASEFGNHGAQDNQGYRVKGLWTPTDNLSLMLTYDYQEQSGTSPTWVNSDKVREGNLESFDLIQETDPAGMAPPVFATPQWYETRYFYRETDTVTAEVGYTISDFGDLTFTYSHNEIEDLGQELTKEMRNTNDPSLQEQDIVELRLTSPAESEIIWVAGIYYQETDRDYVVNDYAPSYIVDGVETYTYQNYSKPFSNANVYGQITYPLTQNLRVTAGMRFSETEEEVNYSLYKTANPCPIDFPFCPASDTVVEEHVFSDSQSPEQLVTWKLGVEYDLDDSRMVYASLATGAKTGGLQYANTSNPITEPAALTLGEYDPEESISLELGSKNRFLDNTLQVNAALFYTEWDDMQINSLVCAVENCNFSGDINSSETYVAWYNADTSTQYGLELDVIWLPTANGRVAFSSSFMKGEYGATDYVWTAPGFGGIVNLDGREMANTPAYAGALSYTHTFDLGGAGKVEVTIEEEFSDSYEVTHEYWWLGATQESYTRTNLMLHYTYKGFDINLFARNLEDETVIQSTFPFGVQGGEPRIYGASLAYSF